MSALTGRHPEWLAKRAQLMVDANSADYPSPAFDEACIAMSALERAIVKTPAISRREAEAKLRFPAILHAEGSVLERDDAADLIADVAQFLLPSIDSEAWDLALATYRSAQAAEKAWDAEHCDVPDQLPIGPKRSAIVDAIPASAWAESERLAGIRSDAEDALMAIPSPDAVAFAIKCRIAHGDGRETDVWNTLLDAEAKLFAGEDL